MHFVRLLAYIAGDGSITVNRKKNKEFGHVEIRFYPDDPALIPLFITSFQYLYRRTPSVKLEHNHYRIHVSSQVAGTHLLSYGILTSTGWRVPFSLLTSPKLKQEWLRAFFDCEGYVGVNCIRAESVNEKGLDDVQKLLRDCGIVCRRYVYVRKNKNWGVNYILNIGTAPARKQFLEQIGFSHTSKNNTLRSQLS